MRVPISWLREYVDVTLSPRELADELTMRGMEVSAIEGGGAGWTDVVVGRLVDVQRHPNADTLWLTRVVVEDGAEPIEIVCGAQNLELGQLVPVARVGAVLPGDRRIERTKIRGVVSNGMLCSAIELGLGPDADGIHILGHGNELPLGTPLGEVLGETVLDVDVKPNRGDALSVVGLAREIAAFTGGELRMPPIEVNEASEPADAHVSVRIEDPELNPRFAARWFDGVANGPSPDWMQQRLLAAGMRPISAVVDVTNDVMHELGQPMHAYDADAVPDGQIVVRRARAGETLVTLDHVERRLDKGMLVIADRERPIGLAGIMAARRPRSERRRRAWSWSRRSSTGRRSATPHGGSDCAPRRACDTRRGSVRSCRASPPTGPRSSSPRSPAPRWAAASSTTTRTRSPRVRWRRASSA